MRLVSWNVAGRKGKHPLQCEALLAREPDLIALQEVTAGTLELWRATLERAGFSVLDSRDRADNRKNLNLIAARCALDRLVDTREPWEGEYPERVLSAHVRFPGAGVVELHNVHIVPGSSRGAAKVAQMTAVYAMLAKQCDTHRILCGDFNTPQAESAAGDVTTFANRHPRMFGAWDAAERAILLGLAQHDLTDLFRALYGYGVSAASWYPSQRGSHVGRRFDHVFASQSLNGVRCEYLHGVREDLLSDHSAIEAVFEPR